MLDREAEAGLALRAARREGQQSVKEDTGSVAVVAIGF